MITLLTAGGILILCAAMIIWDKIRQRKWFLRHLKQRWGTVPDREYTQEELESISHYAKRNKGEQFMIDDITWNDLQMDEIFIRINNTLSSCGEDVLYQILRQPQMDRNVLDERERLIAYFQTHEEERIQVLTRVNEVKKIWKMSIADYIDALKDVDRRGPRFSMILFAVHPQNHDSKYRGDHKHDHAVSRTHTVQLLPKLLIYLSVDQLCRAWSLL